MRRFLNVVPRGVQIVAGIVVACGAFVGPLAGVIERMRERHPHGPVAMLGAGSLGLVLGLFLSCVIAIWLLCLGFVYADAKRRAMRPVLSLLVVILFPNLLGFLLYFVMRQPIGTTCSGCGRTIPGLQPFCSWCGHPQPLSPSGNVPQDPGSSGLDSISAV
jgi:hypothetical protein